MAAHYVASQTHPSIPGERLYSRTGTRPEPVRCVICNETGSATNFSTMEIGANTLTASWCAACELYFGRGAGEQVRAILAAVADSVG
ncbi:MAG: hypothetical protein P4M09_21235 [Devosia sp.]|nr:hypothetical protein [Devosia sp.]